MSENTEIRNTAASNALRLRGALTSLLAGILITISMTACGNNTYGQEYLPVVENIEEVNEEITEEVIADYESTEVMFGAYTYGGVWSGMDPVLQLEANLGRRLDIVHWFMNWTHEWDARLLAPLAGTGRAPMISWQNHDQNVRDIAAGHYDEYIRSWAAGVTEYGDLVYLRPFPEMNGSWTSWNGDPEGLVLAWRRMADIFEAEGARNVRWVWSPNVTDEPRIDSNRMELYYPGSEYVDVLALDGYNWGDVRSYIGWRSFEEIFAEGYERITALGSQPFWAAETASAEIGGDKGEWVRDMFSTRSFPQLEAIVWFDENKETDWRVSSSINSLASFQAVVPQLGQNLAAAQ